MTFTETSSEIIAEGGEKIIRTDPNYPSKVIGEFKDTEAVYSPNQIKGSYYLNKLMHLLFPQNIPNVDFAATLNKKIIRAEKVEVDELHEQIRKIITDLKKRKGNKKLLERQLEFLENEREANENVGELISQTQRAGLYIEQQGRNFTIEKNGTIKYLDTIIPWELDRFGRITQKNFNPRLLLKAIEKLPAQQREQAMSYFTRLLDLEKQEKPDLNNYVH